MRDRTGPDRGSILIVVLIMVIVVASLCMASAMVATSDSRQADFLVHRTQALYVAQGALEDEIHDLGNMCAMARLDQPFAGYDAMAGLVTRNGTWMTKDGVSMGQYDVTVTAVNAVDTSTRDIVIQTIGYVPSKTNAAAITRTINAVVRVSLGRSHVFDYVYFINNWGWYFGDTIIANGNVRANGPFDGGNYHAAVNGVPRFQTLANGHFSDYIDDGGVYSWWNIVNAANMQGMVNAVWSQADCTAGHCTQAQVGTNKGIHSWQDNTSSTPSTQGQVTMPNLTDLTVYESLAKAQGSYIKVGSTTVVNAVQGDTVGEQQNLYLVGTTAAPIVIHGPVVVRGSVIISGVVTGQGCIYSGGNVYVPKNLTYKTPPTTPPASPTQAQMESWISTNANADALGLFARKHVVIGDYTDSSWQSEVSSWVNDPQNESKEDAGADGIPNTKAGRDGILGTADDDTLDGDGVWTVSYYTAANQAAGLIPPGKNVGDVIPGTGEDIDGDGLYTPRCAMSEFNIPASLTSSNWAGNVPSGTPKYSTIATNSGMSHIDAAFYTNHHIAMLTTASGQDMVFNGCVVSRNESLIYGTNHLILNYDLRLLDGGGTFGLYLPKVWNPVAVVFWKVN